MKVAPAPGRRRWLIGCGGEIEKSPEARTSRRAFGRTSEVFRFDDASRTKAVTGMARRLNRSPVEFLS